MQISRSLFQRVALGLAATGWIRCCASTVLVLGAATMLDESAWAQSKTSRAANAKPSNSLPLSVGRQTHRLVQAPANGVPALNGTYQSAEQVPSALGPATVAPEVVEPVPMYEVPIDAAPYASQSMGYEIPCPAGCDISWYNFFEALYFKREGDERFSLNRVDRFPEFEHELGGRITIGRLFDCVNAIEAVYAGPFDWERETSITGAGNLISRFIPSGGYTAAEVSAFNGANVHGQLHEANLNNYEVNRRWWAWDVLSTMIGVRAVDYREHYAFVSSHPTNGTGIYLEDTENLMLGVQVGGDWMYPMGPRSTLGMRGKGGVFANFDESRAFMINSGTLVLDAVDRDIDIAGIIEYGVFGRCDVLPSVRLTAGYEFWFLPGVATVPGQGINRVHPDSGNQVENDDEVFFHGGTVGAQILF